MILTMPSNAAVPRGSGASGNSGISGKSGDSGVAGSRREFRFGVTMIASCGAAEWRAKCRRAEELGFDVILTADHLGCPAPLPSLVAAAEATRRPGVGTFVLNAGFWNPALLTREVATTDLLTGGRLELGLGAGYARDEFERAGIPWQAAGSRIDQLERAVDETTRLLADENHEPRPEQRPRPPLMLGGNGNRVLRLAAERADIITFAGMAPDESSRTGALRPLQAAAFDERVEFVRAASGGSDAERNLVVQHVGVTEDRRGEARKWRERAGLDWSTDAVLELPILLLGTPGEIAEQLRERRSRWGISYIGVLEPSMEALGQAIPLVR